MHDYGGCDWDWLGKDVNLISKQQISGCLVDRRMLLVLVGKMDRGRRE